MDYKNLASCSGSGDCISSEIPCQRLGSPICYGHLKMNIKTVKDIIDESTPFPTIELDSPGSDCGTKKTIFIMVSDRNRMMLIGSYHLVNGEPELLTKENIDLLIDKRIELRTPLFCVSQKLCNICAGDTIYQKGTL